MLLYLIVSIPGLAVIKLELIFRLKIKRNDLLLALIVALYLESETVLKFYSLEALSFPSSLLSSMQKSVFSQRCPYDLLPDDVTIFGSCYQLLTS